MTSRKAFIGVLAAGALPLSVSASAGEFRPVAGAGVVSAYTKIDVRRDCRHRPGVEAEDYGDWRCRGYAGVPMWVGADDQRSYVSFGPKASEELAAEQTFAPFNSFYKGAVEWRLEKPEGRPFATIVRWGVKTTADLDKTSARGRVLVVTRYRPAPSAMSTRWPTPTPMGWRARSPTNMRAASTAARTSRRFSARSRRAKNSSLPPANDRRVIRPPTSPRTP